MADDLSRLIRIKHPLGDIAAGLHGEHERVDWAVIKEKIRLELKRYIQRETGRRPMIIPVVLEM